MSAAEPRDLGLSYSQALHGMQSAVKFEHEHGSDDGSPKHLRVGTNSAMSDIAAVSNLLMRKGVFTLVEYLEEVRLQMNEELARYEEKIRREHRLPDHVSFR